MVLEFPLKIGYAKYLPLVDSKTAGGLEAKAEEQPLSTVRR
jgi:hypothetical protein